jgi:hypothetical protein
MSSAALHVRGWLRLCIRCDLGLATHPVEGNQETTVNLDLLSSVEQLPFYVIIVSFLVIGDIPNVLVEFGVLWWKLIGWKQLFWLDLELVVHHLFKTFLVGLVAPWQLAKAEVAEEEQQRLNIVLFQILLVWQVRSQGSVHGRANHSKVILFFNHVGFKRLHSRLFLPCFWIYQIFRIFI